MRNILIVLGILCMVGCGSTVTHRRRSTHRHQTKNQAVARVVPDVPEQFRVQYVEQNNTTVVASQDISLNNNTITVTLAALYQGREISRMPDVVGLVISTGEHRYLNKILLLNPAGPHWIKAETIVEEATGLYILPIPLETFVRFIASEDSSIVAFLGSESGHVRFDLLTEHCDLFKRFLFELQRRVNNIQNSSVIGGPAQNK